MTNLLRFFSQNVLIIMLNLLTGLKPLA